MASPRVDALCAAALSAWPDIALDRAALAAAVAARGDAVTEAGAAEIALALAIAGNDAAAFAHFERRYLDVVAPALAPMRLPAATVEDVRARVRDHLLLPVDDGPPRLLGYAGEGRLRGLVQVTAVRQALTLLRKTDRERDGDAGLADLAAAGADAELALIKAQYRTAFADAFAAAAAALERRDRTLLRLHHLDGMGLEALAAMYGVHRATVVRWLAAARARLLAGTRARLVDALGRHDDLDEVLALVESRLDVSVGRLLASLAPASS